MRFWYALNLKVRAKIVTLLLKNWNLDIFSVQIQWEFSDSLPFYSAGSWVSALSGPAAGDPDQAHVCTKAEKIRKGKEIK